MKTKLTTRDHSAVGRLTRRTLVCLDEPAIVNLNRAISLYGGEATPSAAVRRAVALLADHLEHLGADALPGERTAFAAFTRPRALGESEAA